MSAAEVREAVRAPDGPWPADQRAGYCSLVTDAYGLHSPIAEVEVFGRRKDSPVVMRLEDGCRIRAEAGDYLRPLELARILAMFTGGRSHLKETKTENLRAAFTALMTLAVVQETDDEVAEVQEWVQRFLRAGGGIVEDFDLCDGDSTYQALGAFQGGHHYAPHSGVGLVLRDTSTGDLYVRVSDLVNYVREVVGVRPLSATTLNSRMAEAGHQHRVLQQWKPGADRRSYAKRKVSAYRIRSAEVG